MYIITELLLIQLSIPTPSRLRYRHDAHDDPHPPPPHGTGTDAKPMAAVRHVFESTDSLSSSHSQPAAGGSGAAPPNGGPSAARPDKPPRPAFSAATDCQTLNRAQYRSAKESTSSSHARPSALPKGMLFANRSTENLSDKGGGDGNTSPVQLRDRATGDAIPSPTLAMAAGGGKPAIPERPMSLMRPNSFKTPMALGGNGNGNAAATTDSMSTVSSGGGAHHPFGGSDLKKTHSFRGVGVATATTKPHANGQTTLERTHIYNVDKKQVAIIDFVDSSSRAATATTAAATTDTKATPSTTAAPSEAPRSNGTHPTAASIVTGTLKITPSSIAVTPAGATADTVVGTATDAAGPAPSAHHVPPSPRGFDPKIKRPQIPAPPPPVAAAAAAVRPKSEAGDSTHL